MKEQDERGIISWLADQNMALAIANMGYVVIAAWKNKKGVENPPHYATVRPGIAWALDTGISVANVGSGVNGVKTLRDGFGGENKENVWFYFNPSQEFIYKPIEITKYDKFE